MNATINVESEMQNLRFEITGQAKLGETRGLMGRCPDLAHQESVGWGFRRV